jgi:hypothetical protein
MGGSHLISANSFARHSSVWSQATPTLEQVVRWANERKQSLGSPVSMSSDPKRHSLVAETAFLLMKHAAADRDVDPLEVEQEARTFLQRLPRSDAVGAPLATWEWADVDALRDRSERYIHWLPSVEFSTTVPGCGVVDQSLADVASAGELIEIKAVARPFRGNDFRQVLTYAAMFYSAGRQFERITLLNPVGGYYVSAYLDQVSSGSSGTSAVELLQDLVERMSSLQVSA